MEKLTLHVESLIFVAAPSISFNEIKNALDESLSINFSEEQIYDCIDQLTLKYNSAEYAIEVVEISGGFRFMTKPAFHQTIGTFLRQNTHKKLSKSALETLSIIAYKQPVAKSELEAIRGVNSDYTIQKLLEKDLVEITGRSDGPGKPLLYGTTSKFTDYFGLKSIDDLPQTKEIEPVENTVGEQESLIVEQKKAKSITNTEEE